MGPNARLRLISDRFVAGHDNCALRRHLDSVPPENPIPDIVSIVDHCRVWESHADTGAQRIVKPGPERSLPLYTVDEPRGMLADRMVAAVTVPPVGPDGIDTLLRRLLPTIPVLMPPPKPIPTELGSLLQCRRRSPLYHLGPGLRHWRPCWSACFRGRRSPSRGRDRALLAGTGLRLYVSPVANQVMEWAGAPS